MNRKEQLDGLARQIAADFPAAKVTVDHAPIDDGISYLNVVLDDYDLVVDDDSRGVYAVTSAETHYFGEGPHEVYKTAEQVLERVKVLLSTKTRTKSPFDEHAHMAAAAKRAAS